MSGQIYEQKAIIYKALAHPIRIQIVELLADGEKGVSEIIQRVGAKGSNTSRHLAVLKSSGVVRARKDGMNVYYELLMPCLVNMFSCVDNALVEKARFHSEIAEKLSL